MLSLTDALSFSFCRRSFVLGTVLLFVVILSIFGMGEAFAYMMQHHIEFSKEGFEKIAIILYVGQILGYSILFAYLYIRAKHSVYNLPPRFSSEFFIRVFLTFFCMSAITSMALYLTSPYAQKYILNSFLSIIVSQPHSPNFPWLKLILKLGLPMLGVMLVIGYLWSAVYMAYIMNFNFQKFWYKFLQVLRHPLIYLQLVAWGILLFILTYIPVLIIYWILKSFSKDIVSSSMLAYSGSNLPIIPLVLFAVIFGTPITIACFKTRTGQMITLLFTLLYFMIYGLVWIVYKQSGLPFAFSIPITVLLYFYIFFYLFCLMFIITSIILPTGLIHLMAQGAFQVQKTFEPNVGEKHPQQPIEIKKDVPSDDDGWL